MSQDGIALPGLNGQRTGDAAARFELDGQRRAARDAARPAGRRYTTTLPGTSHSIMKPPPLVGHASNVNSDQWCGSWRMYWPDGRRCRTTSARWRALKGKTKLRERTGRRSPNSPTERAYRSCLPSLLRDAAGEVVGALNMFVDISERKRSEELRSASPRLRVE